MSSVELARRVLTPFLGVLLLSVALTAPAAAEPNYPPVFNQVAASSFRVAAGKSLVFRVQTFRPRTSVSFAVRPTAGNAQGSGSASADARGVVTQRITFQTPGRTTVTFTGTGADSSPLTLSTTVQVVEPASSSPANQPVAAAGPQTKPRAGGAGADQTQTGLLSNLPATGAQILGVLAVGGLLVLVGAVLVVAGRRRQA